AREDSGDGICQCARLFVLLQSIVYGADPELVVYEADLADIACGEERLQHRAREGDRLFVLTTRFIEGCDLSRQERVFDQTHDRRTRERLDQQLDGSIIQLVQFGNACGEADAIEVRGSRVVVAGTTLRDDENTPVLRQCAFKRVDGLGAAGV